MNEYVVALQMDALYCEFQVYDKMLLDQIIYGVKDLNLQRQLLAKPNLTLQTAQDEARATENSIKSTAAIQKSANPIVSCQNTSVHQGNSEQEEPVDEENKICHL